MKIQIYTKLIEECDIFELSKKIRISMNQKTNEIIAAVLMILSIAFYRVLPFNTIGIIPILSICIFSGAMIQNKKFAFAIPLLSLLLSDVLFYFLHQSGYTVIEGTYTGQLYIYICYVLLIWFGTAMKNISVGKVALFSINGSLMFFIASNFIVWATHTGLCRPLTFSGLMMCYGDALAFYRDYGFIKGLTGNFIVGDLIWSTILFGTSYLLQAKIFLTAKKAI